VGEPPKLKMWLPWSELMNLPQIRLDDFRERLRKQPRSSLLIACARLSIALNYGPEAETAADEKLTALWIPILFPPNLIPYVSTFAVQGRIILFQGQLRMLATETLRLNPAPAEDLPPAENDTLGELLLRAGELLYKPHVAVEGEQDSVANLIATFLPIYELGLPTDPIMPFLRFYIFLTINIPRLPVEMRRFDVPVLFESQFGFALKLYYEFIFTFINHALNERAKTPEQWPIDGAIRASWFKKTTLDQEPIKKMFETVCFSLKDLPDTKPSVGYADFEFLRDHPYFEHDGELYCLDYEYAVGKLESGALWRVLRALDEKQREPYLSFWGNVFEDYVAWLFEIYANATLNKVYPAPIYPNEKNKPICDLVVICGSTAILIEAKLATCRTDVRYAGDYKAMKKYLEDKLVVGTNRPVGVAQLLTAVCNLSALPQPSIPTWLQGIKKLMPVILTKDEIGSSWAVNSYLNMRFTGQLKDEDHKGYEVAPLVSLSVSALEKCLHALNDHAFSEVLEERINADPKLGSPFEAASSFVPRGTARKVFKHVEIIKEIADQVIADFGMVEE
jgi:hypothetical protein